MLEVDEFEQFRARAYSSGSYKEFCVDSDRESCSGSRPATPPLRRVYSHRMQRPSRHKQNQSVTPSPLTLARLNALETDHEQTLIARIDSVMSFERESVTSCDSEYDNNDVDTELDLDSVSQTGRLEDNPNDTEVFRSLTPQPYSQGSRSPYHSSTPPLSPTTRHTRSYSCKASSRPRRPRDLEIFDTKPRQRTYSMPTRNRYRRAREMRKSEAEAGEDPAADEEYIRVRSFSTAGKKGTKGIINRGDSFRRRSARSSSAAEVESDDFRQRTWSATSQGSSMGSTGSMNSDPSMYKVLVVGSPGVGKTSLIQQFMTSEYLGNTCTPATEGKLSTEPLCWL